MTESPTKIQGPAAADPAIRSARILSDVFAPAVSVFLICVLCGVAGHPHPWAGLGWGVLLGTFCAVIPMTAIHIAVRREHLTDRHVTRREQRWWVFLVCVGSVLCGMTTTLLLNAPSVLVWIMLTMVAGLVVTGTVTLLGPKVSMHAFCMTCLVIIAALLISPWLLLALLLLLPAVAFARLKLGHHTLVEVILGTGLAFLVIIVAQQFLPDLG
ncbi:hypothetical protein [Pseudarthrobacter sp. GA104]|uniref:hypothetical protein n=1 Tax=Pseudarthrobacter sp. GA104 TaxID=2676311 RepID=UPI0012F7A07D|nr:hypothetical protein [Pseudarthrobacter sp. GA104]MUU73464.1 hypothetical protein [Pseudarthrobacter sp. GA104]